MLPAFRRYSTRTGLLPLVLVASMAPAPAAETVAEPPRDPGFHCVVMPSAVIDVASAVSGRVETVLVERGDAVTAGQVVAALDSRVETANLDLAEARAGLDADIRLRQARLAFEERKQGRTDRLRSSRAVSLHEQDEAETEARLAHWQLRKAIDDKYLAGLELVRAREILERRSVRSPIDGVVVDRYKWPGEYVEEEPILRVARLDPLWVEVVAPVAMYDEVDRDMVAEVTMSGPGAAPHEARVIVIDPMGDAASDTFRVRLALPNPDRRLLSGTKCKARFPRPARYAPEPAGTAPEPSPGVRENAPAGPAPQSAAVDAAPAPSSATGAAAATLAGPDDTLVVAVPR